MRQPLRNHRYVKPRILRKWGASPENIQGARVRVDSNPKWLRTMAAGGAMYEATLVHRFGEKKLGPCRADGLPLEPRADRIRRMRQTKLPGVR